MAVTPMSAVNRTRTAKATDYTDYTDYTDAVGCFPRRHPALAPSRAEATPTDPYSGMPTGFVSLHDHPPQNLFTATDFARQRAFFEARPALRATPLHALPALAQRLGVGQLLAKDETARFGLNAFKATGAMFAIATLRERGQLHAGDTLVCASEGNHGRAVAHAAREAGCLATVYMSRRVAPARVEAIRAEGADVELVDGSYDDAVTVMAAAAGTHGWTVISDTSWTGYDEIPRLIMLGYTRILDEIAMQMSDAGLDSPRGAGLQPGRTVIFVPAGVGGLLAAAACWIDAHPGTDRPRVVAVEPVSAACVQTSIRAGRPTGVVGPFDTVMGGLRCGVMSPSVFPAVRDQVHAFVGIEDDYAFEAMRAFARPVAPDPEIACGPSGAAALGGVLAVLRDPALAEVRDHLRLGAGTTVVVLVTEGVTEPLLYQDVVARR
jgi:diaminopropionate ammonia-lyase